MIKVYVDNTEVLCDKNIVIEEEMLNTSSVILNNVFPKAWETNKDYVSNFYYPPDYSKCLIYEDIPQRLPSAYQEVEYIESTGTQYIDTGMKFKQNNSVEIEIQGLENTSAKIFGSRSSATSNNFSILTGLVGGTLSLVTDFQNYQNNRLSVNITNALSDKYTIKINNSKMCINETEQAISTYTNFTTPGNVYIFSASGTYPAGYVNVSTKLYSCKMWTGTTLVRNFVPCYRKSDNVIGLYDTVNNTFYTNAGTGDFSKGNDIPIQNLLFCGIARNTGEISLNPRYPHYCSLQVLDFKDFLSQGETLDFVLTNITIGDAIQKIIDTVSDYGFVLGNIDIIGSDDIIGTYSTLEKTAYDVFNYLADMTQSKWTTRMIDQYTVAVDFYDPTLMPTGTQIEYTTQFFEDYGINDMSFSYSTNDYRNKQTMTSDEVFGNVAQNETIIADGYSQTFALGQKVGEPVSITVNGVSQTFTTNDKKEIGITADFYYTSGDNMIESEATITVGSLIEISYLPIIKGRQIITNTSEVERIALATGRKGVIARYENRSDATTSNELQKIGQAYIQYKGSPEILLTIKSTQNTWNVGQVVEFDAPLNELSTSYLVKRKTINIISTVDTVFYTYELSSNFNSENAINYFDNQRAKNSGNIGEGEFVDRNIDIENTANIIFSNTTFSEVVPIGDNELNCELNAPLIV